MALNISSYEKSISDKVMQQSARYGLTWREAYDRASSWGDDKGLKLTYGKTLMQETYSAFKKNYSQETNLINLESDVTPTSWFRSVGRSWQAAKYLNVVLLDVYNEETEEWFRETRAFGSEEPKSLDSLTTDAEESKYGWGIGESETITGVALYRVYEKSSL